MTTAKDNESTRERILEKGLELFSSKGYHGTGLKEILDAAGIPKGSFYHYFESKEHFAVEIIHHYRAIEFERCDERFDNAGQDFCTVAINALNEIIDEFERGEQKLGYLILNLSGELADSSPYFRKALRDSTEQILAKITEDMAISQQAGAIRSDLSARQLATHFWDCWQGALLRAKLERSVEPLRQTVSLIFNDFMQPR
jgi:TetR/AcrR family transcriptional repressor of nem operon